MRKRKPKPTNDNDAKLHAALSITASDLEANAAGELTPAQKQRLWQQHRSNIGMSLVLLLAIGSAALFMFSAAGMVLVSSPASGFTALPLVVFLGLIIYLVYRHFENMALDIARSDLMVIQGHVRKSSGQKNFGQGQAYRLHIDSLTFKVGPMTYSAFREGELYRLYYTSRTKSLVAAEWLEHEHFDIIDAE